MQNSELVFFFFFVFWQLALQEPSSNCWMQDYLYQLQGEPGNTQVFMGEKHMLGDFVKFNNNGGSVNKAEHRHHCCLHGWTCMVTWLGESKENEPQQIVRKTSRIHVQWCVCT